MTAVIVQSSEIVTLFGASLARKADLIESLNIAPTLVAADGGAVMALNYGAMPDAVIGDFDSLDEQIAARIPADRLHRIIEQDCTDFDKALRHISAPLILALGFTGQRLDHELAVYNALVRHAQSRVIVIGSHDICFHVPPCLRLSLPLDSRVSLFPLAELCCQSEGLRWPTDALTLSPWGRVGTSNIAIAETVELRPDKDGLLAILPRDQLRPAMQALHGG